VKKLTVLITLALLLVALTSCQTLAPEVKVVYEKTPLPAIEWPVVPDHTGLVTESNGVVSMPLIYWLALVRYIIDIEAGKDTIEAFRTAQDAKR